MDAFLLGTDNGGDQRSDGEGVDELHIVYTEFKSMLSQSARPTAPMVVEQSRKTSTARCTVRPDATMLLESLLSAT